MLSEAGASRLWQVAVVAALLLVIAASYPAYRFATGTDDNGLGEDQQLFTVSTGDLLNQVSVSGSIYFPHRETLSFGTSGTVGEVLVNEGDSVAEGQPLAVLNTETVANLEQAVARAEFNLRDAEKASTAARIPYSTVEIAQAEAAIVDTESAYMAALDALELLTAPRTHAIAQAEAEVANARLAVQEAEEHLAAIITPSIRELTRAELRVTEATLELATASAALQDLMDGPDDEGVADAQFQIDMAVTALTNAELQVTLTRNEWDSRVEDASDSLEAMADRYSDVFLKWLGIELNEIERTVDPDALLQSWNADLVTLFDPKSRFSDLVPYVSVAGVPIDDPVTRWDEPTVYLWANFFPGEIDATCGNGVVSPQGSCVSAEIDDPWEDIPGATDRLQLLETQAVQAVSNAESAVQRAKHDVAVAEQVLSDLLIEPDPLDVESRGTSVELARAALQESEQDLAELNAGPDALEVEAAEKQLALAEQGLVQAEDALADLMDGPEVIDLKAGRVSIDLAAARLVETQQALDERLRGADPVLAALKEADMAASSAALDSARNNLERATLTAPWDGVVSSIVVEPGHRIDAGTPVFEVVDESIVEVEGMVDEIDVLLVNEGASASVTMDALPGKVLRGVVSQIATKAENQQGVVSYPINIRIEALKGLSLPEGLSAVASVVIREDRGVLLVPLDAVSGTFDRPVVRVMNNGIVEERPVSLGNNDDFWIVVQNGIAEGDRLVIQAREASTAGLEALKSQFGAFKSVGSKSSGAGK